MTAETTLIFEIWESIQHDLKNAEKIHFANDLIQAVYNYGFEYADIASLEDEDFHLAKAIQSVYSDEIEDSIGEDDE